MTEKHNEPFIQRLAKIYKETYVEPDWSSIINNNDRSNKEMNREELFEWLNTCPSHKWEITGDEFEYITITYKYKEEEDA